MFEISLYKEIAFTILHILKILKMFLMFNKCSEHDRFMTWHTRPANQRPGFDSQLRVPTFCAS